jgi:hypothetical protein
MRSSVWYLEGILEGLALNGRLRIFVRQQTKQPNTSQEGNTSRWVHTGNYLV